MGKSKKQPPKREKRFSLELTQVQVELVRDALSVVIDPRTGETISQQIAKHSSYTSDEAELWDRVVEACESMGVAYGDQAPDYVISMQAPELGIIKLEPGENVEQNTPRDLFVYKEQ